jgi:cobyrinic acid a,c-diamide synthase
MLGLLDLETSFENKKLHLGYRTINGQNGCFAGSYSAHEFHYATTISAKGKTLFSVRDAENNKLPDSGLINETSSGSFLHIIDKRL